jgi:hypothetical protein
MKFWLAQKREQKNEVEHFAPGDGFLVTTARKCFPDETVYIRLTE